MSTSVNNRAQHTVHHGPSQAVAKGEEAIAQSHRIADTIVSAPATGKQVLDFSLVIEDQPSLPKPHAASKVYQGGSDDDENLIALIGILLLLQAKQNANNYKTMWLMASMNMQMAVELAPLAGKAVLAQFTAQSFATLIESDRTSANGSMLGMTALSSVGKGIYDVYKKPKSSPSDRGVGYSQEGTPQPDKPAISDKENQVLEKNDSWNFGKTWNFISSAPIKEWAYDAVENAADFSKQAQGFSKIMIDATDAKCQAQEQSFQGIQKMAASTGRGIQAYSKLFDEVYSKTSEIGQAFRQNIASALRLMEQAQNTILQSGTAMFRG